MEPFLMNSLDFNDIMIERLNFLHKVSQKISEIKPLPKLLHDIMEGSKFVMDAEASSLLLYNPSDRKLYFHVATGLNGNSYKQKGLKMGEGIAGWVAKNRVSQLIDDCYSDPRFDPRFDQMNNFITRSMLCVPLFRKRKLIGVMQAINKNGNGVFNLLDLNIFETLASQCVIAIENSRYMKMQIENESMEHELEVAREIQKKLLPAKLPDYKDIDVAASLIPAKQVGGDYYDVIKVSENKSLFVIADVTGKGVPAALIVSTVYSCLQTFLRMCNKQFDLLTFVHNLNKVLIDSTTFDKFVSCWFGIYEHDTRMLTYLNAGHNPPFVLSKNYKSPLMLNAGGIFLGCLDLQYTSEQIMLAPKDVLVFYTDGVTEAMNKKGDLYGEEALIKILQHNKGKNAAVILSAIQTDVALHVGKAGQSDDLTCVVVKVN